MGILRVLATWPVLILWKIYNLKTILRFWFKWLDRGYAMVISERVGQRRPYFAKAAIFVGSYPHLFFSSTLRALEVLAEEGFDIFLVWNGRLDAEMRAAVDPLCVSIVEREQLGFDWAGYKLIMTRLYRDHAYKEAGVFLLNDSFYFFKSTKKILKQLMALTTDVRGLVLNKEVNYHLVGAFLYFSAAAWQHASIKRFWIKFRPSWDKLKTIRSGELAYSRAITKAGLSLSAVSSVLMLEESQVAHSVRLKAFWRNNSPNAADFADLARAEVDSHQTRSVSGGLQDLYLEEQHNRSLRFWGEIMETTSVLHVLGPYLSAVWGVPLKLDLLKWDATRWTTLELMTILHLSPHLTPQDFNALQSHFLSRDSWASVNGTRAFFRRWGHS